MAQFQALRFDRLAREDTLAIAKTAEALLKTLTSEEQMLSVSNALTKRSNKGNHKEDQHEPSNH